MTAIVSILALFALVFGVVLGYVASRERRRSLSLGFGLLGLAAGMVLGLSHSPVIAAAITAGFTLTGALVGHLFPPAEQSEPSERTRGGIDSAVWLPPFAGMLSIGLLAGITVRVNELLLFRKPSLKQNLLDDGFTTNQVERMLERYSNEMGMEHVRKRSAPVVGLMSAEAKSQLRELLEQAQKSNMDSAATIKFLYDVAPASIIQQLRAIESSADEPGPEETLGRLRGQVLGKE